MSTPFREVERYWKTRKTKIDLRRALSYEDIQWTSESALPKRGIWSDSVECIQLSMEGKFPEQKVVVFPAFPGILYFPQVLSFEHQRKLIVESLTTAKSPNLNSLSPHYDLPLEGLWAAYVAELKAGKVPGPSITDRQTALNAEVAWIQRKDIPTNTGRRQQIDLDPITADNYMDVQQYGRTTILQNAQPIVETSPMKDQTERGATLDQLLSKLRWTNLGWFYNWATKAYDFDKGPIDLPPIIHQTCKDLVSSVNWEQALRDPSPEDVNFQSWGTNYKPEAGVVNFYQPKDSLTAHIDQSEIDATSPLVSLSIGTSAIFLIGGPTRDTTPLPILLRSGDAICMCGKKGRRSFHGVPRILEDTLPEYLSSTSVEGLNEYQDWKFFGGFMERGTRINVNVRQVFS